MGFLEGKTAIITGAGFAALKDGSAGSIGYGIATAYAKEGANLVITGRNVKKLETAKEKLEAEYGIQVLCVAADVNAGADNQAVVQNVIDQAIEKFGRIDVLVNDAGTTFRCSFEDFPEEEYDRVVDTNMKSVYLGARIAYEAMKDKGGVMLLASSFAAVFPSVGSGVYAATKSAVKSMVNTLAAELAPYGIRVNGYIPGHDPRTYRQQRRGHEERHRHADLR